MRARKVAVVCDWFFWLDGSRFGSGGVETYLQNLILLLRGAGCEVAVFQRGTRRFSANWQGCPVESWRSLGHQTRLLEAFHGATRGATIYSDFHVVGPQVFRPAIVIQHGVYWDVRYRRFASPLLQWMLNWKKSFNTIMLSRRILRIMRAVDRVITVDTNFQNWMRTMCGWEDLEEKWNYIPNFAVPYPEEKVEAKLRSDSSVRRVLFARRFEPFRGTWLWANVVKKLAAEFPEVEFCFCGHGQMKGLELRLSRELGAISNARLYEKPWEQMPEEHFAADIEVVPSYGSEGTSFSLLEAMAAGACVVASGVGGLSNIVLHEFNGLLVQPTEEEFKSAVVQLIRNPRRARRMARNAYQTVISCFSRRKWEARMTAILSGVLDLPLRTGELCAANGKSG